MHAGFLFTLLGFLMPSMLFINFLTSNLSREILTSMLGQEGTDILHMYLVSRQAIIHSFQTNFI